VIQTIANAFTVPEIRRKIAFTAAMLALYRLGAYIPSPGIDVNTVKDNRIELRGSNILGFLNLFSGGSLSRLSLFALGIMPYITASIILQIAHGGAAVAGEAAEGGESASRRSRSTTRYLTVGLAFAQGLGYVFLFRSFQNQAAPALSARSPSPRSS